MSDGEEFRRADLRAFELLGRAKDLVGSDYWVFLGITALGVFLAGLVPFGILMGPMMVGIHLAYGAKQRGEKVELATLFKGFDRFAESLVAALVIVFGSLALLLPAFFVYAAAMVGLGREGSDEAGLLAGAVALVFYTAMFVFYVVVGALVLFVFPLLADRAIGGIEALKLGVRAALANFWGALRLSLLTGFLGLLGTCACFVGAFFVLPLTMGMIWLGYREVFPEPAAD